MKAVRARQKRKASSAKPAPLPGAVRPAWPRHALLLAALVTATLFAYSNSFSSGFIFDNRVLLLDARITAVTSENLRLILTRDYWYSLTGTGLYRPLATASYLLNYAVLGNGTHPVGWHWINFALHAANVALVYALGLLVLGETAPAFALAALWALHPVLTESVTNIIGRSDLLSAFGVLAGLLCHVRATAASGWHKRAWLAALMLAAAIGLFSKESAVVLPAVMALYDFTLLKSRSARALAPSYLVLILPFAIFFYARSRILAGLAPMHIGFTDNPLTAAGFWSARFTAVKIIGKYLWLLLWPVRLSCDYSYNQVPVVAWPFHTWEDWQTLIALACCGAAVAIAIVAYRRRRPVFFFIAFFFITLSPTSNLAILIGSIMGERFLYLPSIGFTGCLVVAIYSWLRSRRAATAALAVIAIAFAVRTSARNLDWLNDITLWTSAVEASPNSYKAHMALASALNNPPGAHTDAAIHEVERAFAIIESLPDSQKNPAAYIDGGSYYGQKGELLAIRKPDGTLVATPQSNYWYHKALESLLRAKRIEAVNVEEDRRRQAGAGGKVSNPAQWYELYLALGAVYLRLSQPSDALAALEHGVRFRPVPEFFEKMSAAYSALGDPHRATLALLEGLAMDPGNTQFAAGLVNLYKQIDPQGCAIRNTGGNASLNMECPLVHADVCAASQGLAAIYRTAGLDAAARRTGHSAVHDLGCPAAQFPRAP